MSTRFKSLHGNKWGFSLCEELERDLCSRIGFINVTVNVVVSTSLSLSSEIVCYGRYTEHCVTIEHQSAVVGVCVGHKGLCWFAFVLGLSYAKETSISK
jgi:hypothetical protein